jgi:hypothetical protein
LIAKVLLLHLQGNRGLPMVALMADMVEAPSPVLLAIKAVEVEPQT